jgi:hypothetical protein
MIRTAIRGVLAGAVLAAMIGAAAPQQALALSNSPDQTGWTIRGKVYAQAYLGNTMFAGGTFKVIAGPAGIKGDVKNIAAIDMTTGAWISSFGATVENTLGAVKVSALAVSPDGSTLYIGGTFDTVDGEPHANFAAVDTTTGANDSAVTIGANKAVDAIVAGPNLVYFGGAFTSVAGSDRRHLAAMAYDGTLSAAWAPTTDAGNCPAPYYNDNTCSNGGNGTVRSLAMSVDGQTVFVGGEFYYVNGTPRNCIGRVSAVDGSLDPWAIPFATIIDDSASHKPGPNMTWHLLPTGTRLYAGLGRIPNYFQAFHLDNGTTGDSVWKQPTPGNPESMALSPDGTRLFVGGHFGTAVLDYGVCGTYAHGLISVNPVNGVINCDWLPSIRPFGGTNAPGSHLSPPNYVGAWTMFVAGNSLWVGGYFTSISLVPVSGVARFTIVGSPPPPAPVISAFTPTKGPIGTVVTITGFGFTGTTDVQFGTVSVGAGNYTVDSDAQITATVPPGAVTAPITVVAPGGTATSGTKNFHVTA